MSAFPRKRPSTGAEGTPKRLRTPRRTAAAPPPPPEPPAPPTEAEVSADLEGLERRVEESLREIQAELTSAASLMLESVCGSFQHEVGSLRTRVPEVEHRTFRARVTAEVLDEIGGGAPPPIHVGGTLTFSLPMRLLFAVVIVGVFAQFLRPALRCGTVSKMCAACSDIFERCRDA